MIYIYIKWTVSTLPQSVLNAHARMIITVVEMLKKSNLNHFCDHGFIYIYIYILYIYIYEKQVFDWFIETNSMFSAILIGFRCFGLVAENILYLLVADQNKKVTVSLLSLKWTNVMSDNGDIMHSIITWMYIHTVWRGAGPIETWYPPLASNEVT